MGKTLDNDKSNQKTSGNRINIFSLNDAFHYFSLSIHIFARRHAMFLIAITKIRFGLYETKEKRKQALPSLPIKSLITIITKPLGH